MGRSRAFLAMCLLGLASACGVVVEGAASSEVAQVSERADRGWVPFRSTVLTDGIETQNDQPPEADVELVGATSAGYLAAGNVNAGFAIWSSPDMATFTPVYHEVCCSRWIRPTAIAEFDGTLLVGGSGEVFNGLSERTERAFLFRSDDDGASWSTIEDRVFVEHSNRIDAIDVVGDSVIISAVDDRERGTPDSHAVRSTDLVSFEPIALPGAVDDDWPYFVTDGSDVFAVSSRFAGPDGTGSGRVFWSSSDSGRTFAARPSQPPLDVGGLIVIDGRLVFLPSLFQSESLHLDARGPSVLEPGEPWIELPPDVGQFGDGFFRMRPAMRTGADGLRYAIGGRQTRASAHYCYDDVDTCEVSEIALMATDDGLSWTDVAGPPGPESIAFGSSVDVRSDGTIVIWSVRQFGRGQDSEVTGHVWLGDEPPARFDPEGYPPPGIPLDLYDFASPFPVGAMARYVLGTGFCGGMFVDGKGWEPTTPLPDPIPSSWPYRAVQFEDGPEGFVYGRIERVATDEIAFSIEGIGDVATFRPAPPRTEFCG